MIRWRLAQIVFVTDGVWHTSRLGTASQLGTANRLGTASRRCGDDQMAFGTDRRQCGVIDNRCGLCIRLI